MPFEAIPFSLDSNEKSPAIRRTTQRSVLLIGASLFAFVGMPSAAYAQNECGVASGDTVECPPSGNPYPTGISYPTAVSDLTVVLDPTDNITNTVRVRSTATDVDLRIQGGTNTHISTTASGAPGVDISSSAGTVYASLDVVSTTGSSAVGVSANSSDNTTVLVHNVTTTGKYSDGIHATVTGPTGGESQPGIFITSGSISTSGKYSDGIDARNPLGTVSVTSTSIQTTGAGSRGINIDSDGYATVISGTVSTTGNPNAVPGGTAAVGINVNADGGVNITSGTVTTTGTGATGIDANSKYGSITIGSTTVSTSGNGADGIDAFGGKYGTVTITSGTVTTHGTDSQGIYVNGSNQVTVTSGTVTTFGNNSGGIVVHEGPPALPPAPPGPPGDTPAGADAAIGIPPGVVINSTTMTTHGNSSPGIDGVSLDGYVEVNSGSVHTYGNYSTGINAHAYDTAQVTSTSVITGGHDSIGINAYAKYGTVTVTSGTVLTNSYDSTGIRAYSYSGNVTVTSGSVTTHGADSPGIQAGSDPYGYYASTTTVHSTSVTTTGINSDGIEAFNSNLVIVTSGTVSTSGGNSTGIVARQNVYDPYVCSDCTGIAGPAGPSAPPVAGPGVYVSSGSITTLGANSLGIDAYSYNGFVTVVSTGTISTAGTSSPGIAALGDGDVNVTSNIVTTGVTPGSTNSPGIFALSGNGNVHVTSTAVTTNGASSPGIEAYSIYGTVSVTSGAVTTHGTNSGGIEARGYSDVTVSSTGTVTTTGSGSTGIFAYSKYDNVSVTSATVTTTGATNSGGIVAIAYDGGNSTVTSGTVSTTGTNSTGIYNYAFGGTATVTSTTVTTQGAGSAGIDEVALIGNAVVTSGNVTTNGASSAGIAVYATGNTTVTSTGTVTTHGLNSDGIDATARGRVVVTSNNIVTTGNGSEGIYATELGVGGTDIPGGAAVLGPNGGITITSGNITTSGTGSTGIDALAYGGDTEVTSTGLISTTGASARGILAVSSNGHVTVASNNVTTTGAGSTGITATGRTTVTVTSNNVTTSGAGAIGILARQTAAPPPPVGTVPGAAEALGPSGGISITSGNITTGGANATGIDALAANGNVEIFSTGTIATTGASAVGILASSTTSSVLVDTGAVTTTGATSDAISVTSANASTSTITIRGLVQATNGFEVQANGGAATVNTTAAGTIRGAIDLTDNADRVNNAGLFDAIGTSLFGAGADIFTNTGTVRSTNGAAVFAALENFNNSGLVDLRDSAVGDTLNVTGAYVGSGAAHLGVDANIQSAQADVLITGPATGSTVLDVNLLGTPVFNLTGTLVVDATAGTSASAFTLSSTATSSPWVKLNLLFDAPNNNFLLVGLPDQPVFETVEQGEMLLNFWYQSADGVSTQLEGAHDGVPPPEGGTTVTPLRGGGRFGGWVQGLTGDVHRDTSQSFTNGGNTTVFDTSYHQDFQGLQGGLDYQAGGAIVGVTFGIGKSDARFNTSFDELHIDGTNVGLYAAFNSGAFFFNALGKVDWADVDSHPGAGISTSFNATAWGLRGTAGFHFGDRLFAEPTVSLSWVNVDIDDYVSSGASVNFDHIHSLRGAAGVRFGARLPAGHGTFTPFIGIQAVDEFKGNVRSNFTLGSTIALEQDAPGTFGELSGGLNFSTGRLEAFVRGEVDFGSERDGLAGRAGLRLRF
jgi:hypothetical protein